MSAYFRQLSYRRILLLVLAGSQLFPLPDLPSDPLTPAVPHGPDFSGNRSTVKRKITMQHDQRQLFEIACDYPWYHFTAEEISVLCNIGEHKVRLARNAKDTPFRFNLCRPEWFTAWMLHHPEYQDLKSAPVDMADSLEACAASVKKTLCSAVRAGKKTVKPRKKRRLS